MIDNVVLNSIAFVLQLPAQVFQVINQSINLER